MVRSQINEFEGVDSGISVVIRNYPCLVDENTGEKQELSYYFNANFVEEFIEGVMKDFDNIKNNMEKYGHHNIHVNIDNVHLIELEIRSLKKFVEVTFLSDVLDAIRNGYEKENIKEY
jgi:hypothetical protein